MSVIISDVFLAPDYIIIIASSFSSATGLQLAVLHLFVL
jgi:hypothetical protein